MRLVCILSTFKNDAGQTDLQTDLRTYGRTDTTSYRDATAHLKIKSHDLREYTGTSFNRVKFFVLCGEKKFAEGWDAAVNAEATRRGEGAGGRWDRKTQY